MNFDEKMRARAKIEDCPVPADFDARLGGLLDALPDSPKRRLRPLRTALIAAAVCILLCASTLALSPTLREAFSQMLGSFAPYIHEADGVSVVEQGIRIQATSTLADQNDAVVYLEITDITGDRLDESMYLEGGRVRRITAYDPKTKTALLERKVDLWERNEDGTVTLIFPRLLSGVEEVAPMALPWDLVTVKTLDSFPAEETEVEKGLRWRLKDGGELRVLAPEQTPAKLDTGRFSLSSMGFDEQGTFHVQIALAEGVQMGNPNGLSVDLDIEEGLREALNLNEIHVLFGGGKYLDIAYPGTTVQNFGQFRAVSVYGQVATNAKIEGDWTLTVPLDLLPERTVTTDETLNNFTVDRLCFSVMSLRMEVTYLDHRPGTPGFAATLFLGDGSEISLNEMAPSWEWTHEDSGKTDKRGNTLRNIVGANAVWSYPTAVDPSDIIGVAIGQRYIPVDGGTAGEGRWLPEVP